MNKFWKNYNKKSNFLSKRIIKYNEKNNFNFIENYNYNHIRDLFCLITAFASIKKKINILDYGSNVLSISNIKNKIDLKRAKIDIFDPYNDMSLHNLPKINNLIYRIISNFSELKENNYDVINFGSVFQYDDKIFNTLSELNYNKNKIIIVTHTPFSLNKKFKCVQQNNKKIVQNIHPLKRVLKFFKLKGYKLIFKSRNSDGYIKCKNNKYNSVSLNLVFFK